MINDSIKCLSPKGGNWAAWVLGSFLVTTVAIADSEQRREVLDAEQRHEVEDAEPRTDPDGPDDETRD